jgi:hypothetical protein
MEGSIKTETNIGLKHLNTLDCIWTCKNLKKIADAVVIPKLESFKACISETKAHRTKGPDVCPLIFHPLSKQTTPHQLKMYTHGSVIHTKWLWVFLCYICYRISTKTLESVSKVTNILRCCLTEHNLHRSIRSKWLSSSDSSSTHTHTLWGHNTKITQRESVLCSR